MLLLFVTSYRPLYLRDVLNIVCLPVDAQVRLAYTSAWLQPGLKTDLNRLKGQTAIVTYCDFDENTQLYRYLPLRWVELQQVESLQGDYVLLTIRLRSWLKYAHDLGGLKAELDRFNAALQRSTSRPNTTPQERAAHRTQAFVVDVPAQIGLEKDDDGWSELARYLARHSSLSAAVFMREVPSQGAPMSINWSDQPCTPVVKVEAGRTYDLRLRMIFGKNAPNGALPVLELSQHAAGLGPFLQQAGGAVDADFAVAVERSFESRTSMMRIAVVDGGSGRKIDGPEISGVVRIQPPRRLLLGSFVLVMLGLALLSLSPDVREWISGPTPGPAAESAYWLFKVLGWAAFGCGTWLITRKAPSKGP